ncbi:MAG: hypothetical protein ACKVOR_02700 [Flavobacteriales bacterium]
MKKIWISNTTILVLLFLFTANSAIALTHVVLNSACADTIILDGEYIYIEKQDVIMDVDSLEEAAMRDLRKEKIKKERANLDLVVGFNANMTSYGTSVSNKQPLDVFMGQSKSIRPSASVMLDGGIHLFSQKVSNGERRLSLRVGLAYNHLNFMSTTFTDPMQLEQDSILRFYTKGDRLVLEYFNNTDPNNPLIGEVDTIDISLTRKAQQIKVWDVPLRLRYTAGMNDRWSWMSECGIIYRMTKSYDVQDHYLISQNAEPQELLQSDFKVKNQLLATLGIGAKYYLNGPYSASQQLKERTAFSFILSCVGPPYQMNQSEVFYLTTWSISAQVGIGIFF